MMSGITSIGDVATGPKQTEQGWSSSPTDTRGVKVTKLVEFPFHRAMNLRSGLSSIEVAAQSFRLSDEMPVSRLEVELNNAALHGWELVQVLEREDGNVVVVTAKTR